MDIVAKITSDGDSVEEFWCDVWYEKTRRWYESSMIYIQQGSRMWPVRNYTN